MSDHERQGDRHARGGERHRASEPPLDGVTGDHMQGGSCQGPRVAQIENELEQSNIGAGKQHNVTRGLLNRVGSIASGAAGLGNLGGNLGDAVAGAQQEKDYARANALRAEAASLGCEVRELHGYDNKAVAVAPAEDIHNRMEERAQTFYQRNPNYRP